MTALRGLYVVTNSRLQPGTGLPGAVELAIAGGARVVQYRDKSADPRRRRAQAERLLAICRRSAVPLIINDDLELACAIAADGVHLGRDDADLALARGRLGAGRLIGVSCYNDFDLAGAAAAQGADYVAFGSFFASSVKPDAVRADRGLLRRARAELDVTVVAIGGISPENGAALVAAGADMLAVISAVFGARDVLAAAQAFAPVFHQP